MVKNAIFSLVVVVVALVSVNESRAQHFVRGHVRHNGSYVAPHIRSNPDGNFYNNWSSYQNVNPYTGSFGTRHTPSYQPYHYNTRSTWGWGW